MSDFAIDNVRGVETESTIRLHKPQGKVLASTTHLTLDMAGQRGGKSQMIGVKSGIFITSFPKLKGFIAANTYLQLSTSTLEKCTEVWRDVFNLTKYHPKSNPDGDYVIDRQPPPHFTTWNSYKSYDNIISFKNGHVIYTGSLDNYKAHDGKEFAYAHLDETKDTREVALTSVILGRLSQPGLFVDEKGQLKYYDWKKDEIQGLEFYDEEGNKLDPEEKGYKAHNPCDIHTSPAVGHVDWIIKMFNLTGKEKEIKKAVENPNTFYYEVDEKAGTTVVIYSTYWNQRNLPKNYIAERKKTLSANEQLKFICGYPFSKMGGEYYPKFERDKHVGQVPFLENTAVHSTWDFNVVPYMTNILAQIVNVTRYRDEAGNKHYEPGPGRTPRQFKQVRFYKEYCLASPLNSSEAIVAQFKAEHTAPYHRKPFDVFVYGDASGRNRIPGLGDKTNYKFIEGWLGTWMNVDSLRVRRTNPNPLSRRQLVERILEDKLDIEIIIDESCEKLINDMEYVKLGTEGKLKEREKDDNTGVSYEKNGHTSDALEYLLFYLFGDYIDL